MSWHERDNKQAEESSEILNEPTSTKNKRNVSIKPSFSQELINECQAFVASLSDAVKFSYAGFCATTLHMLYGDQSFL